MTSARRRRAAALVAAGACIAASASAAAQVAPSPVAPVGSAQNAPTREEVTRPAPTAPPPAGPKLTVEGGVQRAPCALADPRFASVTIAFREAVFDRLRGGISPDMLRPAYADLVGKTVPIASVCEVRDAAATILRNAGYLAAVQVPPQSIENGVVHFDVLLPKLVSVHVRGDAGRSEALVATYLRKLVGREVFNQKDAERYLLLTRDLPGYDVRLTLRPADTGVAGDVVGEVSVLRQPFALDFNAQNYGARSVGRFGGLLRGEAYNLLGLGDRLSLGVFSTSDFDEQQVLQGGYEFRLGGEGLSVVSNLTYAWTEPGLGPTLDVKARTLAASLGLRYPLVRAQAGNLTMAGGLDYVNQRVRFAGLPLTTDHIRTLYARLYGDTVDGESLRGAGGYSIAEPRLRLSGVAEARHGIDILDASDRCGPPNGICIARGETPPSRLNARPRALILRASGSAEFRPVPKVALVVSPSAQYSQQATLQYEQFSAGNYTVGRGYDPGAIQGDSGVGVAGEVRVGSIVPRSADDLAIQPFAFVDTAWTWLRGAGLGRDSQRLVSTGGGVRAAWGGRARLDLAVAVPLERIGGGGGVRARRGDTRVLFSITTRLLPWR